MSAWNALYGSKPWPTLLVPGASPEVLLNGGSDCSNACSVILSLLLAVYLVNSLIGNPKLGDHLNDLESVNAT